MSSTKISGLQPDKEYSYYLVLRTSGGTYTSNTLTVKTHSMTNLTGITVTPGVLPTQLRESLGSAIERIGAKLVDSVRIDTTHFVCTEGRGKDWEKASELNIPIVRPEWVEGCEREGKIIGVRGYYLDANPKHRQIGSNPSLSGAPGAQPSPASIMSPASGAAVRASQVDLPRRSQAKSPDRESAVSGEPGPEMPPSPPAQEDSRSQADKEDEESEEENEESEKQAEARDGAGAAEDSEEDDVQEQAAQYNLSRGPERGGDMEEVAL
jgi:chitin biosynthesis protein CHS5